MEYTVIKNVMARFSVFLKQNSITLYNDEILAYLNLLIEEEKDKVAKGWS